MDLYASPTCDVYGNGEGGTYVGTVPVTTDGTCAGSFSVPIPGLLSGVVTAIATDPAGSSSEFSACRAVAPSPVSEVTGLVWAGDTELTWTAASGAVAGIDGVPCRAIAHGTMRNAARTGYPFRGERPTR